MRTTRIWLVTALVLAVVSLVSSGAIAQGQNEGIRVHGAWTIDIRQADGTLVSRHEFQNALSPDAGAVLGALILTERKVTGWTVALAGACASSNNPGNSCRVVSQGSFAAAGPSVFRNLVVTRTPDGIRLQGNATANMDGAIPSVGTHLVTCSLLDPCETTSEGTSFTSKTLPTPINVVTGQLIQVTVALSFS